MSSQIALTNQIVSLIEQETRESEFSALAVDDRAEQLLAILRENDPYTVLFLRPTESLTIFLQ